MNCQLVLFTRIFKKDPCLLGSMLHVNQIDCIRRSTNIEQARFFVMAFDFFLSSLKFNGVSSSPDE